MYAIRQSVISKFPSLHINELSSVSREQIAYKFSNAHKLINFNIPTTKKRYSKLACNTPNISINNRRHRIVKHRFKSHKRAWGHSKDTCNKTYEKLATRPLHYGHRVLGGIAANGALLFYNGDICQPVNALLISPPLPRNKY